MGTLEVDKKRKLKDSMEELGGKSKKCNTVIVIFEMDQRFALGSFKRLFVSVRRKYIKKILLIRKQVFFFNKKKEKVG